MTLRCDSAAHLPRLAFLRDDVRKAQEALGDKAIDVFSLARVPDDVSLEEAFQNLKTLKDEGLIGAVGASEMKAESLEKAHKVSWLVDFGRQRRVLL